MKGRQKKRSYKEYKLTIDYQQKQYKLEANQMLSSKCWKEKDANLDLYTVKVFLKIKRNKILRQK